MMTNYLKSGFAAALIAGTIAASPALAADESETVTALVEYSDLDLSTEDGQDVLHRRLRDAAQYVCGMDIRNPGTTLPSGEARACYVETIGSFEREVATMIAAETRG